MKLLLKQGFLPVYHDFHCVLVAALYVKESESEISERSDSVPESGVLEKSGVGRFIPDSAILLIS